jgi:hypothetical protein
MTVDLESDAEVLNFVEDMTGWKQCVRQKRFIRVHIIHLIIPHKHIII